MGTVVAILTSTVVGLCIAVTVDTRLRGLALLGCSFLYGTIAVHFAMLVVALTGVRWSAWLVTSLLIVMAIASLASRGRLADGVPLPPMRWHIVDLATAAMIAAFAVYATLAPVWEWDFWAIWGLKARVFAEKGSIDWAFLTRPENDFAHPDYPLLLPLNYAYAALMGGGWSDRWLGAVTVGFVAALLLIVRHLAAGETGPLAASTIAFAATAFAFGGVSGEPGDLLRGVVGLADPVMIAFATPAILFLRRGTRTGDAASLHHAAILFGGAASTKNEGLALLVAAMTALLMTRRAPLRSLWPAVAIAAPWLIVRLLRHLSSDIAGGSFERALSRMSQPFPFSALVVGTTPEPLIWLLLLIGLAVAGRHLAKEAPALLTLALQFAFVVAVYATTPHHIGWHVTTSWPRVAPQIGTPLLVVTMLLLANAFAAGDDRGHHEARPDH